VPGRGATDGVAGGSRLGEIDAAAVFGAGGDFTGAAGAVCGASADQRLPVLVLLRRYAKELSDRPNLGLVEYVIEVIRADFSLSGADLEFFEYYLESGHAILLFDGLDELSDSGFKQTVRERIQALATTYPGNTVIVTSRVVGYENPFRFDDKEFQHFQVARLQLPEMKQFVIDWYAARIEHPQDRVEHARDLTGLLEKDEHSAIRELAGNPLLLTIIALVHRIDAVLPDERVVLYQKCTETLLNTWHNWKYKEQHTAHRGKTERRNSRRMEAIAHWMQTRADQAGQGQRAVVEYEKLREFLRDHVRVAEKVADDEEALDLAAEFLEFVKKRAGLLIEVVDQQYSFVHLTFQEYLTAAHMATQSELEGVANAWSTYFETHRCDPAWREVFRLFVASLKADDSQEYLVDKLLEQTRQQPEAHGATLLGGLILDGIAAAEERQREIAECLLHATPGVGGIEELRLIIATWRGCSGRSPATRSALAQAFVEVWEKLATDEQKFAVVLMLLTSGWSRQELASVAGGLVAADRPETVPLRLVYPVGETSGEAQVLPTHWESFVAAMQGASSVNYTTSLMAAAANSVATVFGAQSTFLRRLALFATRCSPRDSAYLLLQSFSLREGTDFDEFNLDRARESARAWAWDLVRARARGMVPDLNLTKALDIDQDLGLKRDRYRYRFRYLDLELDLKANSPQTHWNQAFAHPQFEGSLVELYVESMRLEPKLHWEEALRVLFVPTIRSRIEFPDRANWQALMNRLEQNHPAPGDEDLAAVLLLLDALVARDEKSQSSKRAELERLAECTRASHAPVLRLAHCLRDLADGDESRTEDLVAMVRSEDPATRKLMEECLWRLTPKEIEAREAELATPSSA
jgi:hypothetical protein